MEELQQYADNRTKDQRIRCVALSARPRLTHLVVKSVDAQRG
jgi:hypothetical protein